MEGKPGRSFLLLILSGILFFPGCVPVALQAPANSANSTIPQYSFIDPSGQTSGSLSIRAVELKFQNGLGDITLPLHTPPQPEAIIKFNGNGLFQAHWLADGRIIETVGINVTYGKTLKLKLLNISQITAFAPGSHTISLIIQSPATTLNIPVIHYFMQ